MNLSHYDLQTTSDRLQVKFTSTGPKGAITKVIEFTYIDGLDFWNLGFGDYDLVSIRVDDQVVTDNNDGRKVLATVALAIQEFLAFYPEAVVFFTGSTDQRTRVYRWAISAYWLDIADSFQVDIVTITGDVVPFPSTEETLGFLVRIK